MSDIIDLDELVPEDKRVTLKGRTYTLPGDMPMATYLRINSIAQKQDGGATQEDLLDSTVKAIVELFYWRDGDSADRADKDRLENQIRGMGVRTVMAIISKVYPPDDDGDDDTDADKVAEDPTPPASGTTTSPPSESSPSAS